MTTRVIDRRSAIPYYYQLQEILKEEIEGGHWSPGDLLPSEADLEKLFGISRTVIRQALDVLEADGQVFRVKGKGAIIAPAKFRHEAIFAAASWTQSEADSPGPPTLFEVADIRRVKAGTRVEHLLRLEPHCDVFELTFTHAIAQRPSSLVQAYVRVDATPSLGSLSASGGLPQLEVDGPDAFRQLYDKYGLIIAESQVLVESTLANEYESKLLRVPKRAPMFLLSSLDMNGNGTPIAFSRTVVKSQSFKFSIVVRHGPHSAKALMG